MTLNKFRYNYVKGETDTIGFGRNYLLVDLSQVTPPGDHLQLIFVETDTIVFGRNYLGASSLKYK